MQGAVLYLSAFTKMLKNDVSKYQKRHKADTIDNTSYDESSDTTKLIPRVQNRTPKFECKNRYHIGKISQ